MTAQRRPDPGRAKPLDPLIILTAPAETALRFIEPRSRPSTRRVLVIDLRSTIDDLPGEVLVKLAATK